MTKYTAEAQAEYERVMEPARKALHDAEIVHWRLWRNQDLTAIAAFAAAVKPSEDAYEAVAVRAWAEREKGRLP